jgi:hypothetical protein
MKRFLVLVSAILLATVAGISWADDVSVDQHIKNLKAPNPETRAKAAYELGCG